MPSEKFTPPNSPKQSTEEARPPNPPRKKDLRRNNNNDASTSNSAAVALGDDDIKRVVDEMDDIAASESEDQQLKLLTHGKIVEASIPPRDKLADPSTKPSLKPRKSEDDIDIESIPTLDSITEAMWILYTDLQKCRIVMHYGYSSIPRFERYMLKIHQLQ